MENREDIKDKARKIVALLPKKNCGKCGYNNCGEFAIALAGGKASPYDCHKNQSSAREIAEIAGIELPERTGVQASAHGHHHLSGGIGHHFGHHHGHHCGRHGHGRHHEGGHHHSGLNQ